MYHLFFLSSLFIRLLSIFIWNKPFLPVKPYPGKARSSTGVLLSYDTRIASQSCHFVNVVHSVSSQRQAAAPETSTWSALQQQF
jgi:hypothetical protein